MDNDDGLELSLGLFCGGSSGKRKSRDVNSDAKLVEGSSSKVMGGSISAPDASFNNLFQIDGENHDHNGKKVVSQPNEKFWTDLANCSVSMSDGPDTAQRTQSLFVQYQELWKANNKATEPEDENSGKKPCLHSEEISFLKRHEKVVDQAEASGKCPAGIILMKHTQISVNTDDGSTGENEDVAESEAEGSNSWMVSQREDGAKSSDVSKITNKETIDSTSMIGIPGQKVQCYPGNESNPEYGKVTYGIPLSLQPLTVVTVPYSVSGKVPTAATSANAAGLPSACVMQLMPVAKNEQPAIQTTNTNCVQVAFGYSSTELPTLEANPSWAFSSQLHLSSSFADGTLHAEHVEDEPKRLQASVHIPSSSGLAFEVKSPDPAKASVKLIGETGTSSSVNGGEESKGTNNIFSQKEAAQQPVIAGFSHEGSVIKPGIASNVKFGGCGSYPDLPWVSTTGSGPNGKTISGVIYKYGKNLIKIVCACHGSHMSPEEFIQHARADATNPENNFTSFAAMPASNPAASMQN